MKSYVTFSASLSIISSRFVVTNGQSSGYQREKGWGGSKMGKEANYMVTDGNKLLDGEYIAANRDVEIYYTLKTNIML